MVTNKKKQYIKYLLIITIDVVTVKKTNNTTKKRLFRDQYVTN